MNELNDGGFQLLTTCPPPLKSGQYTLSTEQNVKEPATDNFQNQLEFYVSGSHFMLPPEEVNSVYPPINGVGPYGNSIGHITLKNKTLPWTISAGDDSLPWLALIAVASDEGAVSKELTVRELLETNSQKSHIFYPLETDPSPIPVKSDALCRVVDLPRELYLSIMPRQDELVYLAHAKKIDAFYKCDQLTKSDGYFSIVTSNRFIPKGTGKDRKSTLHLVSLEGFLGFLPARHGNQPLGDFDTVRMVSLYSWDVYTQNSTKPEFEETLSNIKSGTIKLDCQTSPIFDHGCVPLKHITRTGEETVSIYRGPLSPYKICTSRRSLEKMTADGLIIYDKDSGIFDMSYAAAWQLGRLLALRNKSIAASIVRWRHANTKIRFQSLYNEVLAELYGQLSDQGSLEAFLLQKLCPALANDALIAPMSKNV